MTTQQAPPRFAAGIAKQNGDREANPYDQLRRPFVATAVKFRPMSVKEGQGVAVFYIDARSVEERLSAAVGSENWSNTFRVLPGLTADAREMPALGYPIECVLTVNGVTKSDTGQGPLGVVDEKSWKTAYSDAFKRAAVKFGVGTYLYALPRVKAPVQGKFFTAEAKRQILREYDKWLKGPRNLWGDPWDHGDLEDFEHGDAAGEPVGDASAGQGATTASAAPAQPPNEDTSQLANVSAVFRALPLEKRQALAKAYHDSTEDSPTTRRVSQWLIEQYPRRLDDLASLADDLDLPF